MKTTDLSNWLAANFPRAATSWSQATDEIRDMSRYCRVIAGVSENESIDFRLLKTPTEWNSRGADSVLRFHEMLTERQQSDFDSHFSFIKS